MSVTTAPGSAATAQPRPWLTTRIGVESALGLRQSFWLGRRHAVQVERGIDEALTQAGLTGEADRLVGERSHGDQRAAEIGRR